METNTHQRTGASQATLAKLEECYQAEVSALETYEAALAGVDHVGLHHGLQEILASHGERVSPLAVRLQQNGGQLPKGSGARGMFAKAIQGGADLLGIRAAITALEAGERLSVALYTDGLEACDAATRGFLQAEILPLAQRTYALCQTLKTYVGSPS